MAAMHKCGQGWAYCDGNCATCAQTTPTYTSTSTDHDFRYLGRQDWHVVGGRGAKIGMSGFITRIEPGKDEPYTVIFTTADLDKYSHIVDECRKMLGHAKPMTNADKYFRNATDEELADWCYEHQEDCLGCPALRKGCMNFGKACKDAWLNWLKQEAESDELLRRDGP